MGTDRGPLGFKRREEGGGPRAGTCAAAGCQVGRHVEGARGSAAAPVFLALHWHARSPLRPAELNILVFLFIFFTMKKIMGGRRFLVVFVIKPISPMRMRLEECGTPSVELFQTCLSLKRSNHISKFEWGFKFEWFSLGQKKSSLVSKMFCF